MFFRAFPPSTFRVCMRVYGWFTRLGLGLVSRRAKSKKGTQHCTHTNRETPGKSVELATLSAFHDYGNEFVCVNAAVQGWHIHVCRTAIYMYIRGRFVHCKLRNEKKGRQILTHSDNVDVSSSRQSGSSTTVVFYFTIQT